MKMSLFGRGGGPVEYGISKGAAVGPKDWLRWPRHRSSRVASSVSLPICHCNEGGRRFPSVARSVIFCPFGSGRALCWSIPGKALSPTSTSRAHTRCNPFAGPSSSPKVHHISLLGWLNCNWRSIQSTSSTSSLPCCSEAKQLSRPACLPIPPFRRPSGIRSPVPPRVHTPASPPHTQGSHAVVSPAPSAGAPRPLRKLSTDTRSRTSGKKKRAGCRCSCPDHTLLGCFQ